MARHNFHQALNLTPQSKMFEKRTSIIPLTQLKNVSLDLVDNQEPSWAKVGKLPNPFPPGAATGIGGSNLVALIWWI